VASGIAGQGWRILVPACGSGWHVAALAGWEVTKLLESSRDRLWTVALELVPFQLDSPMYYTYVLLSLKDGE
jgi:hypothetical protein